MCIHSSSHTKYIYFLQRELLRFLCVFLFLFVFHFVLFVCLFMQAVYLQVWKKRFHFAAGLLWADFKETVISAKCTQLKSSRCGLDHEGFLCSLELN